MKLLLINANTSPEITDLVVSQAAAFASLGTQIAGATARFGARYVASRAAYAIAGHAALDTYAEHGVAVDGIVLACFGDPGLPALREIAHQPVVGMAEASCLEAAERGRFGIVTGGERWGEMLREFVATIGLADKLAVVNAVAPTGADIARDPAGALDGLVAACLSCCAAGDIASVILGGAGLAGLAAQIAGRVPVPVIDSLGAAIRLAEQRVRERRAGNSTGTRDPGTTTETIGLSDRLGQLLAR